MDQDLVIAVRRGEVKLAQEGKYHTQDEFDKVSLLFKKGQGITEIALEIQRTELATIQIVEKLDLFERKRSPSVNARTSPARLAVQPVTVIRTGVMAVHIIFPERRTADV